LEEKLKGSGTFLVDVSISAGNQILVRLDDDQGLTIDKCKEINRFLHDSLGEDLNEFELQVSSAGLEEPFRLKRQYFKNTGKQVEILLTNNKKVTGTLASADEENILITEKPKWKHDPVKEIKINYSEIKQTRKLVSFK